MYRNYRAINESGKSKRNKPFLQELIERNNSGEAMAGAETAIRNISVTYDRWDGGQIMVRSCNLHGAVAIWR